MIIAFQGERGAFSEIIATKFYKTAKIFPCRSFKELFVNVKKGKANSGIIPIENTLTGRINSTTDLLARSNLKISSEGYLPINHCLICNKNISINKIKYIYGHPEALSQCKEYLSQLECRIISWYDGAAAANLVKNNSEIALIGSYRIAKIHDLFIVQKDIQDLPVNITRFFVIGKTITKSTGYDKTTLVFYSKHKSGMLYNALGSFAKEHINLTRLESMPSREKPWEYKFLVDLIGHVDDPPLKRALQDLKQKVNSIKILGSYPYYPM